MPGVPRFQGFELQSEPRVLVTLMPGRWLLERTTPSWRIHDPEVGFQRMVREDRAQQIALGVLDQGRSFPNAIVLATDADLDLSGGGSLDIPDTVRFLVVDGQHRLWAQRFSSFDATYAVVLHVGLTEVAMAELFLEINDTQKRVPSSLRWDLVRLVRPDDDPESLMTAELVYQLATDEESPLYQRVDLTGEQKEISLKQGSLAPGIRPLLTQRAPLGGESFDTVYDTLVLFFAAIRDTDPDGWGTPGGPLYKARVIRALLRLLGDMVRIEEAASYDLYLTMLSRIDLASLETDRIRASQGNAGIAAIYKEIRSQVYGGSQQ